MPRLFAVLLTAALAVVTAPAGALAVDWSKAQQVRVVTVEYAFKPSKLSFKAGKPYRLHLENKGKETHEFTATDFFKTLDMREDVPLNADHTEIVIQPGEKKDLYFVAKTPGSYDLRCSDHDWAGMTGSIAVTP